MEDEMSNVVDGYELAQRTRSTANDLRADTDLPRWHGRKTEFGGLVGGHVWRSSYRWNPATERVELVTAVDTVASANLSGTAGP
jgi:hypothetical protein